MRVAKLTNDGEMWVSERLSVSFRRDDTNASIISRVFERARESTGTASLCVREWPDRQPPWRRAPGTLIDQSFPPHQVISRFRDGIDGKRQANGPVQGCTAYSGPPLTPDGQPDLERAWLNNSATPFERPKAFEGKPTLTDDEVSELQRRADRLFEDGSADLPIGDNLFFPALSNPEKYKNPNGSARTAVWMVPREFDNRTSLIVDPPNGRIPALMPQAQQRRAAAAARNRAAAGPEDFNNAVRCITPGVPRMGPAAGGDPLYGYYQILQSPDSSCS